MANTMKKLLSVIIVLVMVLSMIPAVSATEETTPAEEITIASADDMSAVITRLANETGLNLKLTLTESITMPAMISLAASSGHKLEIDLGGNTISSDEEIGFLEAHNGTQVTVKNGTIQMHGHLANGSLIVVYYAKLILENMTIQRTNTEDVYLKGGIVHVTGTSDVEGSLTMYDSTLDGSNAGACTTGGVVYLSGGRVFMHGTSAIFGGTVKRLRDATAGTVEGPYGGNLFAGGAAVVVMNDNSKIYDGVADGNNAVDKEGNAIKLQSQGGNIYMSNSKAQITMNDNAQVYNGSATLGGNIRVFGKFTINENAAIYGGTASDAYTENGAAIRGGNLHVYTDGTVTMNGGKIYNGLAKATGNYTSTSVSYYVNGGNVYSEGLFIMNDGEIYGGQAISEGSSAHGGNVYVNRTSTTPLVYKAFIMNGGKIHDGFVSAARENYGSDISILHGRFIMKAGEVYGGTTQFIEESTMSDPNNKYPTGKDNNIQTYATSIADANGNINVFLMFGGRIAKVGIAAEGKGYIYSGESTTATNYMGDHTTRSAAKNADGYWVYTHNNTDGETGDTPHTCTEDGKIGVTCADCAFTYNEVTYGGQYEYVDPAAHAWDEGEVTTKPGCESEGVKTYTCGNCGKTKTETVEATGHEFGEEVYNEETKKFEKVCGVCDKIESREPAGITITEKPEDTTAIVGATETFTVAATGEGQLTYLWKYHREGMEENQWYYWSEPSTTKTSINVKATADRQGYQFKCIITDAYGNTVETEPVTLTVNTDDAIVINTQPAAQDKTAGETAVFSVTATGEDLTYLWQYRREADGAWYYWSNPSKDATSIEVGATVARNGYEFRCVITDANGVEKITEEVALTVNAKELTTTVTATGAAIGETFSMDAAVSEAGEYTYLWKYQRPSMVDSDTWYYWAQPRAESGMTGKATESRIGYRFKCIITDAYGNEMVTDIYELQADGSLTKVN